MSDLELNVVKKGKFATITFKTFLQLLTPSQTFLEKNVANSRT